MPWHRIGTRLINAGLNLATGGLGLGILIYDLTHPDAYQSNPYDPTDPNWKPWGPFDNPDVDTDPGSETIDEIIERCWPLLDIGDGGSAYHKCVADGKRKNDLFPSCE